MNILPSDERRPTEDTLSSIRWSGTSVKSATSEWPQPRSFSTGLQRTNLSAAAPSSIKVMTLQEVADYLRVCRSTIHRLLKCNAIPAFRIGRHWRFGVEEIERWSSSRASNG
jgi:excisionase family DNA binding protein